MKGCGKQLLSFLLEAFTSITRNPSVLLSRSVQACLTSAHLCLVVKAQLFKFMAVSGVWCCCDRWRSVFWQIFKPADSQCKLQEQFNTPFPIPLNKTGKTSLADRYDGGRLNNHSFTFLKCTIVTLVPTIYHKSTLLTLSTVVMFSTVCPAPFPLLI